MDFKKAIMNDPANQALTQKGLIPIYRVAEQAKLLIIGQAPGQKTQAAGRPFVDKSGERLSQWLGITPSFLRESQQIAILPMDFYFLGKGKLGDLPPRLSQAQKWHPLLLATMPQVSLTLLVGKAAQDYYLADNLSVTKRLRQWQAYLPDYLLLPHPSPRNNPWLAKNPWFEKERLPQIKEQCQAILKKEANEACFLNKNSL